MDATLLCAGLILIGGCLIVLVSIKIVRPTEKGIVERLGKYRATVEAGVHFLVPFVDKMYLVNITEQMVDVEPQMVITRDKLNATVDAIVYYRIVDPKSSIYNVDNHRTQLVSLARTTLRSVIGKMSLTEANENRSEINRSVEDVLDQETKSYGVDVLRVELQKIEPPQDVQESMNKVVKAEQEKIAARDLAIATETRADGERMAEIKKAEGVKASLILKAEGEANAIITVAKAKAAEIETVNTSLRKNFKDEAIIYKKLTAFENALRQGTKYVVDTKSNMVNVMSDMAGVPVLPIERRDIKK